jgi:hypothetical protein
VENKGLIFIPDISGFTRFVNATEIEHSRHIIQELLEVIINANDSGLEISEIEGDAVLFYKFGEPPAAETLYSQVEKMFHQFHRYLTAYDQRRICQCRACKSAVELTLKVITHYGEFAGYTVKNFSKLIGKDIILAHQLLKNDIEHHEYWLVTDNLLPDENISGLPAWLSWYQSRKQTENGEVQFKYTYLTPLKKDIPPEPLPQLDIKNKVKVISLQKEYASDINTLFHTAFEFSNRNKWQVGVKEIREVSHLLPQVGTRHRCVLDKGSSVMFTSEYSYEPEKIIYGETDEKKEGAWTMTFEKKGETKTLVHFEVYSKNNPIMLAMFRIFMKKKYEKNFRQSLENLEELVKQMAPFIHTH